MYREYANKDIPTQKLSWDNASRQFTASVETSPRKHWPFLRGPIPLTWLQTAAQLPGKALQVGLAIWYLAGLERSYTIRLSGKAVRCFNVSRKTVYEGLERLETAGLFTVTRRPGQRPMITVLLPEGCRDPLKLN